MTYVHKGMMAGAIGALVLSAYLLLNIETGWMPALDFVSLVGNLTGTGTTGGWIIHFLVGALLGGLFAWLDPDLPGDSLRQRGMIFAGVAWLLMMFFLMPLAGYGVFGLKESVLLPIGAFVLHMIFGLIMGGTYGWLILQGMPLRYRYARERTPVQPVRTTEYALPADSKPGAPVRAATPEPEVHVPPTVEVVRPSTVPLAPGKTVPISRGRPKPAARRPTNGVSAAGAEKKRIATLGGRAGVPAKTAASDSSGPHQPN